MQEVRDQPELPADAAENNNTTKTADCLIDRLDQLIQLGSSEIKSVEPESADNDADKGTADQSKEAEEVIDITLCPDCHLHHCISNQGGKCRLLTDVSFDHRVCPFYKTQEVFDYYKGCVYAHLLKRGRRDLIFKYGIPVDPADKQDEFIKNARDTMKNIFTDWKPGTESAAAEAIEPQVSENEDARPEVHED